MKLKSIATNRTSEFMYTKLNFLECLIKMHDNDPPNIKPPNIKHPKHNQDGGVGVNLHPPTTRGVAGIPVQLWGG